MKDLQNFKINFPGGLSSTKFANLTATVQSCTTSAFRSWHDGIGIEL